MNYAAYIAWVSTLSEHALLDEVMTNTEYLTDGYYRELGNALRARYDELVAKRERQQ